MHLNFFKVSNIPVSAIANAVVVSGMLFANLQTTNRGASAAASGSASVMLSNPRNVIAAVCCFMFVVRIMFYVGIHFKSIARDWSMCQVFLIYFLNIINVSIINCASAELNASELSDCSLQSVLH